MLVFLSAFSLSAGAEVMNSANYKLQSDSVNVGGGDSSSSNYGLQSTMGEAATGNQASANYELKAGYQQMQEVFLSMSSVPNVALAPAIGGITGGEATGSASVTVVTDSPAGYQLTIKASGSPALQSGSGSFADYVPAGAHPDFAFAVDPQASAFGYSPEGADIAAAFRDNGSLCGSGAGDSPDSCWAGLSTSETVIAQRSAANQPLGTATVIKFRAASGASHMQSAGTYTATTTITAIAL
jgi:hypothetical protein